MIRSRPDANVTTSIADFVRFPPTTSFPADIRWTIIVSPPSAVKRSRFALRPTAVKRCPASDWSGGSIVFVVAKWATGTDAIGSAVSASRCAITNASSSGSSGIPERYRSGRRRGARACRVGTFVSTTGVVTTYRKEITSLITDTVASWDAEHTTRKIEAHIGRDLQFIRINGTVVGSLAGLLIYTVSRALGA